MAIWVFKCQQPGVTYPAIGEGPPNRMVEPPMGKYFTPSRCCTHSGSGIHPVGRRTAALTWYPVPWDTFVTARILCLLEPSPQDAGHLAPCGPLQSHGWKLWAPQALAPAGAFTHLLVEALPAVLRHEAEQSKEGPGEGIEASVAVVRVLTCLEAPVALGARPAIR